MEDNLHNSCCLYFDARCACRNGRLGNFDSYQASPQPLLLLLGIQEDAFGPLESGNDVMVTEN